MKKFGITLKFYAQEHFKKKSLIINALFLIVTLGGLIAWDVFGGAEEIFGREMALVQETEAYAISAQMLEELNWRAVHEVSLSDAKAMLEAGDISDIFVISGDDRPELHIISSEAMAPANTQQFLTAVLTAMYQEQVISQLDLSPEAVASLTAPIDVSFESLDANADAFAQMQLINFILPYGIFLLVMMSGQLIANSVSAEKNSRVMEVMLGKVHPTITLWAKVLSGLAGVLLPIIAMVLGVAIAEILGFADMSEIMGAVNEIISTEALILSLVTLIIGYFSFIFLFAAAGAISASVESLTSTLMPLTYALMIPFFLVSFVDIGSPLMGILAYIPIMTPFVLVQRFILGYSGIFEIAIKIAIMLAFTALTVFISARLYLNGASQNKEKITFKDLRKMLVK